MSSAPETRHGVRVLDADLALSEADVPHPAFLVTAPTASPFMNQHYQTISGDSR